MPTTTLVHACTLHSRVHVAKINAWLPLSDPQVSSAFADVTTLEAGCDFCLLLARILFQAQFPRLHPSVPPSVESYTL